VEAGKHPESVGVEAMTTRRTWRPVLAVAILVIVGCGDSGDGNDAPTEVPPGAVAVVDDRAISKQEVQRRVAAIERSLPAGESRPPTAASKAQLEAQALAALLETEWLEREAERRGVRVTMAEARRRWLAASKQQFASRRALRRFLGGQTEADVIRQLRLQELRDRIYDDVRGDAPDGQADKAAEEFERRFDSERRKLTRCRKAYAMKGCRAP